MTLGVLLRVVMVDKLMGHDPAGQKCGALKSLEKNYESLTPLRLTKMGPTNVHVVEYTGRLVLMHEQKLSSGKKSPL